MRVLPPTETLSCNKSGCQQVWTWVVNRATSLVNLFCSNGAKQVARAARPNLGFFVFWTWTHCLWTHYLKRSFSYSGALLWNSLPENVREIKSVRKFKEQIKHVFESSDSHSAVLQNSMSIVFSLIKSQSLKDPHIEFCPQNRFRSYFFCRLLLISI